MDLDISPQNHFLHLVPGVVKLLTCLWHFLPFCVTYLSTSSRAVSLLVTSSHNTMIGDHVQLLVRDSSDVSVQACVSPLSPFRKLVLVKWNGTHLAQPSLVLYVMLSLVLCLVDCSLSGLCFATINIYGSINVVVGICWLYKTGYDWHFYFASK